MDYLTRWRMLLADEQLENSTRPISAIAPSLGYDSESAFTNAFKRVMGCPPRDFLRTQRQMRFQNRGASGEYCDSHL